MNIKKERKDFEAEILANWGPNYQDFTPWGASCDHALPDSEFQYSNQRLNALWLIWQARSAMTRAGRKLE